MRNSLEAACLDQEKVEACLALCCFVVPYLKHLAVLAHARRLQHHRLLRPKQMLGRLVALEVASNVS